MRHMRSSSDVPGLIADYVLLCSALFQQKLSKRTCGNWIENNHSSLQKTRNVLFEKQKFMICRY